MSRRLEILGPMNRTDSSGLNRDEDRACRNPRLEGSTRNDLCLAVMGDEYVEL